ncbi:HEAT repeat domain-containing protein [Gemmata sp. G18]|uniref:HEAT repeat domain-containing protein n=1 Tax=Gemmata palustris TaxID=2822762 RepID=A0ABS5BXT3_9BACT|nr:HEAT repeat domain-containing protein [Gemmata palustris]MBP3958055.1 HEAT repeat domain-containing protein [Gemmata palustris]
MLAEVVDTGITGGSSRYQAVLTITMFGPKAYDTITKLTGVAMSDVSYETRRAIASALGRVGFSETTGPNMKALTALADVLAKDVSASVRMEALQSLTLLGPPWDGVRKAGPK